MFKKKIWVGSAHCYKTVTDWGAVWGAVFLAVIVLAVIGAFAG